MARLPLSQTVDTSRSERSWRSSILSLITSTLVQGVAIVVFVVTPLLVSQTLPAPVSHLQLPDFVSVKIDPPRVRGPKRKTQKRAQRPIAVPELVMETTMIPGGFPEEIHALSEEIWGDLSGVVGGMPELPTSFQPKPPVETPEPAGPLQVGGDIRPPRKIVHVSPVYPALAIRTRIQGKVTLRAVIDEEGNVVNVSVVDSIRFLDRAAVEAVQRWMYEPTYLNGKAVPVIMSVVVEFKLR